MENCSFHSQILSVMEVLATAAVAEINRRVDDSCAVLRLEVSQSRRDIDLLRKKCEVMEAELRRSRMRARRKVFYPPAAERFIPVVKVVVNRERQSSDWGPQMEAEAQNQPQQRAAEAEHILIKEECAEEDVWKNDSEDRLISEDSRPAQTDSFGERHRSAENNPAGSLVSPTDGFDGFPEKQLSLNQNEEEPAVKHEREEEPDENAAPLDSAHKLVTEEGDGRLWSSSVCRDAADPSFSFADQQFEPIPSVFPPQSGMHVEDMAPQIHSAGKSQSVVLSPAKVKRRARTFGCTEGQSALSQINTMDQCFIPQQPHQYRDSTPHTRNPNEDLTPPNPAASSFCGHGRGSFGLARRMRTPWRSGIGEKRFSCSYCDKSFMRFSQLKEHLRSHTGEKPFSCLQCGRSFTKQCNLIRHAVVHSGEKPYECSLCGKCFTQRSSLKSHQKTAH
ncbi:RB-associated KRAB zinc finger protein [Pempheris klunzingeri]|uniref:RB-associated KRAB zinc finger protein n=1 Tax=Pempheris klunzingeri TaxID=3127111 RepID=UPI00398061CE